ncbi:MAG: hypothetical protein RSF67_00710, partial [Clostridia bacterium]
MVNFKNSFNVAIIIVFIIAIAYFIFFCLNIYINKDKEVLNINDDTIKKYVTDKNLVSSHSTYYTLEKIVQNLIVSLNPEKILVGGEIS